MRTEFTSKILCFLRDCKDDSLTISLMHIINDLPAVDASKVFSIENQLAQLSDGHLTDVYTLIVCLNQKYRIL